MPLCFIGSYFGYKKPAPEVGRGGSRALPLHCSLPVWRRQAARSGRPSRPGRLLGGAQGGSRPPPRPRAPGSRAQDPVRTNKIPRQIPEQPWYMNPLFSILIGGILPFGELLCCAEVVRCAV